jgi:hypothetical protein
MSSLHAIRRTLSLTLALSIALWTANATGMLSAGGAAQCHARMPHVQPQAASMPCCPSNATSLPVNFFTPPPCCDLTNQPSRPLAFMVSSGKSRLGHLDVAAPDCAIFVSPQKSSAVFQIGDSPPFVKPVFDLKTDLRI